MFYAKKSENGKWERISKATMEREIKQAFTNERFAAEAMRSIAPWSSFRLGKSMYTAADSMQELAAMDNMDAALASAAGEKEREGR